MPKVGMTASAIILKRMRFILLIEIYFSTFESRGLRTSRRRSFGPCPRVIGGFHFSPCGKSRNVLTNDEFPSKKLGDGERDIKERPRSNYQSGFNLNPDYLRLQKRVAFIESNNSAIGNWLIVGAL
jgi:hypothetical protein